MRMGDGVTGVRLRMHDMDLAWEVARDLALRLKGPYLVSDWTRDNANMFRALKLEKPMMAILLSLIIAMGAFNLVSRSESSRVGNEGVRTSNYQGAPYHSKQN